jgi:hypothetical protein
MRHLFATCAAVAVTALIAMPAPASAASNKAGVTQTQSAPTDISAARRHYRYGYRYGHRYGYRGYGYRNYGYAPYRAYGYDPYYRPYYRPGISVGVGPFGFGVF